jgi:beta-lactamase class A
MATGATVRKLARAALIISDKPAANILRKALGGPARMTALWRSIGDDESRLDCYEPELNLVPTNEFRDTTTPAATARTVAKIWRCPSRARAERKRWVIETQTGLRRVRAGLPKGWVEGATPPAPAG